MSDDNKWGGRENKRKEVLRRGEQSSEKMKSSSSTVLIFSSLPSTLTSFLRSSHVALALALLTPLPEIWSLTHGHIYLFLQLHIASRSYSYPHLSALHLHTRFRAESLTNQFWVENLSGCQLDSMPLKSLKCIR